MSEHSRPLLLARSLAKDPVDLVRHLEESTVLVTLDPDLPGAALTARVLLTTLRRLPGRLLFGGTLEPQTLDSIEDAVNAIDPERPLRIVEASSDCSVHLHIGTKAPPQAIRLVPEAYGGHLVRGTTPIHPSRPSFPLGAIFTAAIGAAEVFKTTASVVDVRRTDHSHLRFCPVSLTSDLNRAPTLSSATRVSVTLGGVGAVGTAIALILGELGFSGEVLLVDKERYELENRGTYSLGGNSEASDRPWKTAVAASFLRQYNVLEFREDVARLIEAIDRNEYPRHSTVFSAFDNVRARHDIQRLWPDNLIDAGTGDTMLGMQDVVAESGPCLMCFLPEPERAESFAATLSQHTGLSVERVSRGDDVLTEAEVSKLSANQQQRLRPHIGKKVCGLAEALGLTTVQANGYRPSVPFVSLQAACLAVGRLVCRLLKCDRPANFVQYDALIGPQSATIERRRELPTCYCQQRADTIRKLRRNRTNSA